jgi:hypothetical protein
MPYIKEHLRDQIVRAGDPSGPGHLNYLFSVIAREYWKNSSGSYADLNDVIGAFEGAKMEFYRRVVVPYEDEKIKENGDIYA